MRDADIERMKGLWDEWERLTRFLESSRVVFARERRLWESLDLADFDGARIKTSRTGVTYDCDLDDHLAAVEDEGILWNAVLVQSFALTEAAAAEKLGLETPMPTSIEKWGGKLVRANGRTWRDVRGGKPRVVEAAVYRNAIAHGSRKLNAASAERLRKASPSTNKKAGSPVTLNYQHLRGFRLGLESLLKAGGL